MEKPYTLVHVTDEKSKDSFVVPMKTANYNENVKGLKAGKIRLDEKEINRLKKHYIGDKTKTFKFGSEAENPVIESINNLMEGGKCLVYPLKEGQQVNCGRIYGGALQGMIPHYNIVSVPDKKKDQ